MIKYEFLSEQLEWKRNQKEGVWRVMCVDNVDAVTHRHVQTHYEATKRKIGILGDVTKVCLELNQLSLEHRLSFNRSLLKKLHFWNAIDANSMNNLFGFLSLSPQANHRDVVTLVTEQCRFVPYPRVNREVVLNQH